MKNAKTVNHKLLFQHRPLYPRSWFYGGRQFSIVVTTSCPKPGPGASSDEAKLGGLTILWLPFKISFVPISYRPLHNLLNSGLLSWIPVSANPSARYKELRTPRLITSGVRMNLEMSNRSGRLTKGRVSERESNSGLR